MKQENILIIEKRVRGQKKIKGVKKNFPVKPKKVSKKTLKGSKNNFTWCLRRNCVNLSQKRGVKKSNKVSKKTIRFPVGGENMLLTPFKIFFDPQARFVKESQGCGT